MQTQTSRFRVRFAFVAALLTPAIGILAEAAFAQTDPAWSDPFETERSFAKGVMRGLNARKYRDLDALAADVRRTRATFDSGAWKLWWFFDAFDVSEQALRGVDPQGVEKLIREWIATTGSVSSRVALAQFHYSVAWQKRGPGFSDTVTPNGWRDYEKHLATATQILAVLEHEGRCDIDCLFLQIEAHTLGGWSDPLRKVLQKEPTYWHAFAVAAFYLVPQWGGSLGDIEKFAVEAADATRTTMGDSLYMKAIVVTSDACGCENLKFDWNRLRKGFEDFQALFPKSRVNLNRFATFAFKARDRETFRRLMGDPLFDSAQFDMRMRRWATEPEPQTSSRSTSLPRVALTELTTSGRTEYPILFYFESRGKLFGVSVASSKIDGWLLNSRPVTSSVRVPADPSTSRSVAFEAEGDPPLNPFPIRSAEPVIRERVTAIACRTSDAGCEAVRIPARIVGTGVQSLQLQVIDATTFDQALGAPVVDDRDSLLGVVTGVSRNADGALEFAAEPIHFTLGLKRTQIPIGAK